MSEETYLKDIRGLIVTCTGCLCLVILVMGSLYGVMKGIISIEELGEIKGLGIGGGFLGLGLIIYNVIRLPFAKGSKDEKN